MILDACLVEREEGTLIVASPDERRREIVLASLGPSFVAGEACGGAEALARLETGKWKAVLFDRSLPDLDVDELVKIVQSTCPRVEVFVKDFESGELVIPQKNPRSPEMRALLDVLQGQQQLRFDNEVLTSAGPGLFAQNVCSQVVPLPGMVGTSPAMQRAYRLTRLVSPRTTTVLLTGESGTGKDLVARAVHSLSPRANNPFVAVNCAAIPEALLETELFGHLKGAFTGALQSRLGRVHAADGGTLFLDEIAELPLTMQAKLLRFLQEGEVQRLGTNDTIRVDVRVVAATNADLAERVVKGQFREDLYYRLAVFPIELEPLRNRVQDIVPLATHFLEGFCREAGTRSKSISDHTRQFLEQYPWPGNVRELRQATERAFIFAEDAPELRPDHYWLPSSALTLRKS